jgi:hypothetical protein
LGFQSAQSWRFFSKEVASLEFSSRAHWGKGINYQAFIG